MAGNNRDGSQDGSPREWSQNTHLADTPANGSTRTNHRSNMNSHSTIRAVTPEQTDSGNPFVDTNVPPTARGYGTISPQTSPRSIPAPGDERRRLGIVFNDAFGESLDSATSTSPKQKTTPLRPRTQTVDGALAMGQTTPLAAPNSAKQRVGSFSSSSSPPMVEPEVRTTIIPPEPLELVSPMLPIRPADQKPAAPSGKEKKSSNRRLIKRTSTRPTSPLVSQPPSVDSLPFPIPTDNANKILLLMKTLSGRMRGEVEFQSEPGGTWNAGVCYIDEERGSLLFDSGLNGPFHIPLVGDLRGCRILPADYPDNGKKCLELMNSKMISELLLRPVVAEEYDLWLASLLCWQQLKPTGLRAPNGRGNSSPGGPRPESRKRGSTVVGSAPSPKEGAIIKVGKVMIWDKGVATSPRAIVKRPSTRDLRSGTTCWRRVSCILQDNGEFKLMTENDVTILSIIELSQLSRCAVQQLDKSVLDEDYCIAIFPTYANTSRRLSIFRPVYIALDSRVLFEVWFVLLRAFAVPDIYGLDVAGESVSEIIDFNRDYPDQTFRVEKTIQVRVTEAKVKNINMKADIVLDRQPRGQEGLTGNYLAEVILDGEVRARTTTQPETSNPFWREDVRFDELPSTLPFLSVILKRVDGNLESYSHQLQASLGLAKTGNLTEVLCGSVDIPLHNLERGKDLEMWHQIYDARHQSVGSMFVKVSHEELVVLMSKDYEQLSELLHNFSTGLTAQIAATLPASLRALADIFLNIFQVSGNSGEWLMGLVEDEIDGIGSQASIKKMRFSRRLKSNESATSASDREQHVRDMSKTLAGEANLLFRGNTLLTQALEFHMRRLGKEYLEETLSDKIWEIDETNPDCEVDPSRIGNPDNITMHWNTLMFYCTQVWTCIAESANRVPTELRQILKYIRAVAEDRYGDYLRTVTYTSVSGFLFLRFICPAILNPKLFGLLRDNPKPRAQRTLTLVAKCLQALANMATFGKKENWMTPMNQFLASYRQPFKDFIDQVCFIPPERSIAAVPASYSTPITILGRMSPVSREGSPSLPYLIDQTRNFAALVKLWLEFKQVKNQADEWDGDLGEFNEVCVQLQRRSAECLSKLEVYRASELDQMSAFGEDMRPDGLVDLAGHNESSSWLDSATTYSASQSWQPPGSAGSDPDVQSTASYQEYTRYGQTVGGRHASDAAELLSALSASGSLRSRSGGKQSKGFLSNLIGGKKDKDKEKALGFTPATIREKSRDKGKAKDLLRSRDRSADNIRSREVSREKSADRPKGKVKHLLKQKSYDQDVGRLAEADEYRSESGGSTDEKEIRGRGGPGVRPSRGMSDSKPNANGPIG